MMKAILVAAMLLVKRVASFPTGAGGCAGGEPAVGGGHVVRNPAGNGSLEDGGFQVVVGLDSDQPAVLSTGASLDLATGTDYPITIESTDGTSTFRGHLLRMGQGDSGVDTTEVYSLTNLVSSQVAQICFGQSPPVGGLTHTDNTPKTSAGGGFRFDSEDTNVPLDVTIVARNCGPASPAAVGACDPAESTYYWSRYILNFANVTSSPTPGATPSPTLASTPGDTPSPTLAPTPGDTPSPTTSPPSGAVRLSVFAVSFVAALSGWTAFVTLM